MYLLPLQVSALKFKYKSPLCQFILPFVNIIVASVAHIKMKKLYFYCCEIKMKYNKIRSKPLNKYQFCISVIGHIIGIGYKRSLLVILKSKENQNLFSNMHLKYEFCISELSMFNFTLEPPEIFPFG